MNRAQGRGRSAFKRALRAKGPAAEQRRRQEGEGGVLVGEQEAETRATEELARRARLLLQNHHPKGVRSPILNCLLQFCLPPKQKKDPVRDGWHVSSGSITSVNRRKQGEPPETEEINVMAGCRLDHCCIIGGLGSCSVWTEYPQPFKL